MSSSSANKRELDAVLPDNIDTELAIWKHLVFDTDMTPPRQNPTRPPHTPTLPPETYTYLIQALLSLQDSAHPHGHPPPSPYPTIPDYNYPWPPAPIAGPSSFNPANPLPPHVTPQGTSSSQSAPFPAAPVPSTIASIAQDPEGTEDTVSTAEDKRRRNTAASARFRTKKKLKTLNLERAVADLTGRTEELEREANDLRRENTWLKEIVLLKGRNLGLNLGSQASASGNEHDEEEEVGRTQAESDPESTAKRVEKGKGKEN